MTVINETLISSLLTALESTPEVIVTFRTKRGDNRAMRCSKLLEAIPEDHHDGRNDYRLQGESIVCVYDFQNSAWRSFRKDSVISFEVIQ